MTDDVAQIRRLQERAARATVTTSEEHRDGVWLRHSTDPLMWWASAALAHDADPTAAVEEAERFYRERAAPSRFQVCPACPSGLDELLASRGYERSAGVSLLTASAAVVATTAPGLEVRVKLRPDGARACVLDGDREVAVGRGVADEGWVGVFDMATMPDSRHRGAGRAVLAALAAWAMGQHCPQLYLQVTEDSRDALALYGRAGFTRLAGYHYRTRTT